MKNIILVIVALFISMVSQAQITKSYNATDTITMFGVDYSKTYFVGKLGFSNPMALKKQYFSIWNNLFILERDKYSIEKALFKTTVTYSLDYVDSINNSITIDDLKLRIVNYVNGRDLLSLEEAKELALSYTLRSENRYGILFFAVEYNKINKWGKYYALIIDTELKKVIYALEIGGKSSGFGFRNYWAHTFYKALKQLKMEMWE